MNELYLPDNRLMVPPFLQLYVEIGAWDKYGRMFHRYREPSRSPVKQLLQLLLAQLCPQTVANVKDITNTNRSVNPAHVFMGDGNEGDDTRGLVVGTDDTAVDMTDYKLASQIAHGNGAGQFYHWAGDSDSQVTVSDPDCTFEKWRNFSNNSGSSVTVKETGMYVSEESVGYDYCIIRDTPTAVAVPDGGGCYVLYTFKISE